MIVDDYEKVDTIDPQFWCHLIRNDLWYDPPSAEDRNNYGFKAVTMLNFETWPFIIKEF